MMNVVSVTEFFEVDILEISETWWMHWKQWDFQIENDRDCIIQFWK